jgi:hypothetical protein
MSGIEILGIVILGRGILGQDVCLTSESTFTPELFALPKSWALHGMHNADVKTVNIEQQAKNRAAVMYVASLRWPNDSAIVGSRRLGKILGGEVFQIPPTSSREV